MARDDDSLRAWPALRPHHEAQARVPLGPQADPGDHHRLHPGGDPRAGRRHPRAGDPRRRRRARRAGRPALPGVLPGQRGRGAGALRPGRRGRRHPREAGAPASAHLRGGPGRDAGGRRAGPGTPSSGNPRGARGSSTTCPRAFPSTLLAQKVQQRAAAVGFDWEHAAGRHGQGGGGDGRDRRGDGRRGRPREAGRRRWAICCSRW